MIGELLQKYLGYRKENRHGIDADPVFFGDGKDEAYD